MIRKENVVKKQFEDYLKSKDFNAFLATNPFLSAQKSVVQTKSASLHDFSLFAEKSKA